MKTVNPPTRATTRVYPIGRPLWSPVRSLYDASGPLPGACGEHTTMPANVRSLYDASGPLPALAAPVLEQSNESDNVDVVVAGHICLDIIPTLSSETTQFTPGRLIETGHALLSTGGSVSNTGLALHQLGVRTKLMGKVGNDLFGQAIFQLIQSRAREAELVGGMVIAMGEASSYSIILSPPNIDRIILHSPGSNDTFGADDVRYEIVQSACLFHFGYPPLMARMYRRNGVELADIFQRVKALGVTTSLDLSMPDPASASGQADWRAILSATLPHVDIFLPSVEELLFMLHRPLFDSLSTQAKGRSILDDIPVQTTMEMAQEALAMGTKIVGLKAGHHGLYLRTADSNGLSTIGKIELSESWANRELWCPCFATHVVGTTGSGDATIAGFLLGLARGMSPEETVTAACAVGACSVEVPDALSGIRSWSEVQARIAAGWPRLTTRCDIGAGWMWNDAKELWYGPNDVGM